MAVTEPGHKWQLFQRSIQGVIALLRHIVSIWDRFRRDDSPVIRAMTLVMTGFAFMALVSVIVFFGNLFSMAAGLALTDSRSSLLVSL